MNARKFCICFVLALGLIAFDTAHAQFTVTVTDQTPTAPLTNPAPGSFEPRYISGFGMDGAFTVFFEDRALGNQIHYAATTSGPTGFPAIATATSIIPETHFVIKDWPITISSTTYAYRAWGSVGNNPQHKFYVSNDLVNWTLVSTFTIPNAASFTNAHGFVYYGFHDVILLNGTYYAFAESNQSQTMLVRSANADDVWEAFGSIGGRPGDGPLELPSGVSVGWTPKGNFIDLGYDRGYGKIYVDPRDNNFYLAINTAAQASLTPAALEAAFIDPANWTWHDGTTGPASNPILSATAEHDLRECWVVPNSNPNADWMIIYDANFGAADGGLALGYATLAPPPPRVHNITQGTHYVTITAGVNAANPGDVILVDAGTFNERVTINKSLDIRGAQYGVDPTASGARTNPATESIIDITGLPLTNPNVLIEIPSGVTNVSLSGFTLIGSPTSHYADEAVVRCWDDDITIEDNIIEGFYAVLFKGADNLTVHRNRMVVNKLGVTVQPSPANNVTISDNLITRGSSPAADAAGIYMTGCSNSAITGNTASGFTGASGANGSNLNHLTVSGNTFTGNRDAISFFGSTTFVTIENNDLSSSSRFGINIKGQDIDILGNIIKNCGNAGVNIDRHVIDTERIRLTCNDISGNADYGVKVNIALVTEVVNAELNWWGDASGPHDPDGATEVPPCADTPDALNADGAGDVVTGNVDYCPWAINTQCQPLQQCGDFALLASQNIELDHYKSVEGDIHSNGGIEFDNGRPGTVWGSVTALGNIEIARDNTINGDVTANGTVKKDKKATVNGAITSGASLAAVEVPSLSYSCTGTASVIAGKDKQKNVAPGDYNVLRADKNAQLNLSAGVYSVKTLQLDDRSRLKVDVSAGNVTINVCGSINFIKNADIIIVGGNSKNLTINYLGTKKVVLGKDGGYQGSVVAPNALVELGSNAGFLGSICAKSIAIAKDARVRHHEVAGGIPKTTVNEDEQAVTSNQAPVTSYQLEQNYPNPFNPSTTISFALPQAEEVTLAIYNIHGQLVRQLVAGQMNAGRHSVVWDATNDHGQNVASGVYLYMIKTGSFTAQRKLVLLK